MADSVFNSNEGSKVFGAQCVASFHLSACDVILSVAQLKLCSQVELKVEGAVG